MSMPQQKPGRSKQDYSTPADFMLAVNERFGFPDWDLAADASNSKGTLCFFSQEQDSLKQDWGEVPGNLLWLNPPFADIDPWAEKCAKLAISHPRKTILLLVPASIGSNWYRHFVQDLAHVSALSPRLSFDGKNSYPKDCILAVYHAWMTGFRTWRWKD